MKPIILALVAVAIGGAIGNFSYQAFGSGNYAVAAERTYFGALALLEAALVIWFGRSVLGAFQ